MHKEYWQTCTGRAIRTRTLHSTRRRVLAQSKNSVLFGPASTVHHMHTLHAFSGSSLTCTSVRLACEQMLTLVLTCNSLKCRTLNIPSCRMVSQFDEELIHCTDGRNNSWTCRSSLDSGRGTVPTKKTLGVCARPIRRHPSLLPVNRLVNLLGIFCLRGSLCTINKEKKRTGSLYVM